MRVQDILDELHEVDIEHLNEKALRLFKAIMKICDQRDLYKQKLDEIENADLSIVYMSGFYDGEKKWKDKIKAKIEELNEMIIEVHKGNLQRYTVSEMLSFIRFCEELLGE